jgi:hypothetical protein
MAKKEEELKARILSYQRQDILALLALRIRYDEAKLKVGRARSLAEKRARLRVLEARRRDVGGEPGVAGTLAAEIEGELPSVFDFLPGVTSEMREMLEEVSERDITQLLAAHIQLSAELERPQRERELAKKREHLAGLEAIRRQLADTPNNQPQPTALSDRAVPSGPPTLAGASPSQRDHAAMLPIMGDEGEVGETPTTNAEGRQMRLNDMSAAQASPPHYEGESRSEALPTSPYSALFAQVTAQRHELQKMGVKG